MKRMNEEEFIGICTRLRQTVRENSAQRHNLERLITEADVLADQLSDCWILLDAIAREPVQDNLQLFVSEVVELLRRHEAPGWKKP